MNGFIEKLGLTTILDKISIHTSSNNLEDIYMELDERSSSEPNCIDAKQELEDAIRNYMLNFKLTESPTIYDYLIMGLTSKDLIATFNWDPLLVQAYARAMKYTSNLPQLAFLHGNVAVGYCTKDNVIGNVGMLCRCGEPLAPTKLLFPIKNKDYASDTAISKSWKTLSNVLEKAYMVTIFGYSAPKSDVAAIGMLKKAWGAVEDRKYEEIEIIDVRGEDEVIKLWEDFIHTHHYSYHTNFFTTTIGRCPRRSCEATFDRLMMNNWLEPDKGFKAGMDFDDIDKLIANLIIDEENKKGTKNILLNPYV